MRSVRLHQPDLRRVLSPKLGQPIGRYLVGERTIKQTDLIRALEIKCKVNAPLGEILIAEGVITRAQMLQAISHLHHAQLVNLEEDPPEIEMANCLPSSLCLRFGVAPWAMFGSAILVATNRPDEFGQLRACLGQNGPKILPVIADHRQIRDQIWRLYGVELAQKAATRVPAVESCRVWQSDGHTRIYWAGAVMAGLGLALALAPMWALTLMILWAFLTLLMSSVLKLAALWSYLFLIPSPPARQQPPETPPFRLPRVSVLVPLFKETQIADVLIKRLSKLTYPKSVLDIVLVLEADDQLTRQTIANTQIPDWMSVVEVPAANNLTTKPRALNFALDFCKGSIVGVWDAEDAPEPDQIERVVNRLQRAPKNVACLQGRLDYYNTRTNWISRCFTIEYATWWRVLLPGIAHLGLVIPLGGTTLFFRREILEGLRGWDAHNVTEDADLGVRLARHGYVTEILPTVTYEEANCRAWPWVKQRSRWLKGFLITWCVHMRAPRALLKDLGWKRFLGVQTMLLATFSQFACAPLLWSFWLVLFGLPHPISHTLGPVALWGMVAVFILSELSNLIISALAVSDKSHRHLLGWVLTLPFYFPMGVLAAYKGLYEMVMRPFYWDKTQHGITQESTTVVPVEPDFTPTYSFSSRRAASCLSRVTKASEM